MLRHGRVKGYWVASHTIPMKRELKGSGGFGKVGIVIGFTHHPDEEGTERSPAILRRPKYSFGFTHHPDEEGTERAFASVPSQQR